MMAVTMSQVANACRCREKKCMPQSQCKVEKSAPQFQLQNDITLRAAERLTVPRPNLSTSGRQKCVYIWGFICNLGCRRFQGLLVESAYCLWGGFCLTCLDLM